MHLLSIRSIGRGQMNIQIVNIIEGSAKLKRTLLVSACSKSLTRFMNRIAMTIFFVDLVEKR